MNAPYAKLLSRILSIVNSNWLQHARNVRALYKLEVNKCAFTFASEKRQIQCMRTEFWCVHCPRPTGPSALNKHQIQSKCFYFSTFPSGSKCKFIYLIHMPWNMKSKSAFYPAKNMDQSMWHSVWAQWVERIRHFQNTSRIYSRANQRTRN